MKFIWHEGYSVGVEEIDNQHREIIESINKLYDFIYNSNNTYRFDSLIDDIEELSRSHFLTEEKYFDKFKYELADEHKAEHNKFFDKILEVREKLKENKLNAAFQMAAFMEKWLVDHMLEEDQKYVKCFKEHGLS